MVASMMLNCYASDAPRCLDKRRPLAVIDAFVGPIIDLV